MPFSWKKVKSSRLTQWVNDHLHKSQKRRDGSSLVVETGFPASLIDLFIKNREKLKKSSKKKRDLSHSQSAPLNDFHDPVTVGSPTNFSTPLQCHSPLNSPLNSSLIAASLWSPSSCPSSSQNSSLLPLPKLAAANVSGTELVDRDGGNGAPTKRGTEKGVDANGVISAVAKIFIVVVLALTTKSLTVGITISAFLLLFMEYIGKHLSGFAKPCIQAKEWFRFSVTLSCSKRDTVNLENDAVFLLMTEQEEEKFSQTEYISMRNCDSKCVFQEIEIVEQKYSVSSIEEIQSEKEIKEDSCSERWSVNQDNYLNFVEKEYTGEAIELKRKSRKEKLKLKMRRFVPKKFRSLRTENNIVMFKNDKDSHVFGHEEQASTEFEYEKESEIASTLSAVSSCRYRDSGHIGDAIARLPEIVDVASVKKVEMAKEKETGLSWMYFVLCLTVLIGLIGGRAFALGLTLLLMLLMKLGKTLQNSEKMPTIVSSNENSG